MCKNFSELYKTMKEESGDQIYLKLLEKINNLKILYDGVTKKDDKEFFKGMIVGVVDASIINGYFEEERTIILNELN